MEMNRSAGEPMQIPAGSHFAGQMILPDNNGERVTRLVPLRVVHIVSALIFAGLGLAALLIKA